MLFAAGASAALAQEEERLLINPGRETFIHFPTASLGNKYTLTVFLPEPYIPLKGRYPLAVLLGAGPKQAQEAAAFLEKNKMIVAAVNFEEADYASRAEDIQRFLSRELMPYLETNYPVLPGAENRIIAARGENGAKAALRVLAVPGLFGGVSLASPGGAWTEIPLPQRPLRAFVTGTQGELALAQRTLENAGFAFGPDFALEYQKENASWFGALAADYLFAPRADLQLTRFSAGTDVKMLALSSDESAVLRVLAYLKNGLAYDYVPARLRMSPPYLNWNAEKGILTVLPGAESGTVKIRPVVDKPSFTVKIKLKKQ